MMNDKIKSEDYVYVLTIQKGGQEEFLGLQSESGESFVPVTATRDEALRLAGRLPEDAQGSQVEAIHRAQITQTASEQGFAVYLVDQSGSLQERLAGPPVH